MECDKVKSERPTKDGLSAPFKMNPNAPARILREGNRSTGDYNLNRQRREAHAEALKKETEHYNHIHPYRKPKPRW